MNQSKNDLPKLWSTLNEVIGGVSGKSKKLPNQLILDYGERHTVIVKSPQEFCECFNKFFVNVGEKLANSIPNTSTQNESFIHNNDNSFFLRPVSVPEILSELELLDPHKSCGHDLISSRLTKDAAPYISEPLCHIINLSFSSGKFPDQLKIARVTPVYKKGTPYEPSNYRPISILPILSKIINYLIKNY